MPVITVKGAAAEITIITIPPTPREFDRRLVELVTFSVSSVVTNFSFTVRP